MTDKIAPLKLPLPLPGDVDLSGMPHMPVFDEKLLASRSWLHAKSWRGGGPGLGFCLFNLWAAAFRSVPGGSLEDDDDVLADMARCDIDFWLVIKDKALRGWERHGGRVWHPVICALVWPLWLARLEKRHHLDLDSHRASAKRAMDKGRLPPDPPGGLHEWMAVNYPATYALLVAMKAAQEGAAAAARPPDISKCPPDIDPKRSEGNVIPPLPPAAQPVDEPERGRDRRTLEDRGVWFAKEKHRLLNEFRDMAGVMLSNLQRPGVSGEFGLVQTFKGCWLDRASTGRVEIVVPSKQRADAIVADHGQWIRHYWPELAVRHAKVDELRTRKTQRAA